MSKNRKIYFVVASGGHETDKHYVDTIKNKRTLDEARQFLSPAESNELEQYMHGQPFSVWGAVPGSGNTRNWDAMEEGDYILIYKAGHIILAAEVAMKVRNPKLAKNYWGEDADGKTWELIYFMINEAEVNIPMEKLNRYLGYGEKYFPRGFMAIEQTKVNELLSQYGDLLSILQRIQVGQKPEEIDVEKQRVVEQVLEEQIEKAPTDHTEMQWRLIRLGQKAHFDVWVPRADQGRAYEGQIFRDHVVPEFHETIDVPSYIKNIDTVWKFGYSIKSAFEIENSTQIYSGILRLSDLRTLAPNSNYPLFIVAQKEKKSRVREQVHRPTFASDYLQLDRVVNFLSYDSVRKLDEDLKGANVGFEMKWLMEKAEGLS